MIDDVPEEVKMRRLREVIALFHSLVAVSSQRWIGTEQLVMVKGVSVCVCVCVCVCVFVCVGAYVCT